MKPLKVYACYNTDENVRLSSSSGGVFSLIAEYVIKQHGIVYGVAMSDDCYLAEFISVTDRTELFRLRGSKYLQARVGDTYKLVKKDLLAGKIVLFTGTGCQVNGLRKFLGENYENLICMDVICHGTPSPALWRKYVRCQEMENNGKVKNVNFRCKDSSWVDFGIKKIMADIPEDKLKKVYLSKNKDFYMQMFLKNYCLRPSCYECMAKDIKMSDLTIADFWGIEDVVPEMNDGMGASLVLIRTDKGRINFEKIKGQIKVKEVSYEEGVKKNPSEFKSVSRPPQRDTFFKDMHNMSLKELEIKYTAPIKEPFIIRIKVKIRKYIVSFMRLFNRDFLKKRLNFKIRTENSSKSRKLTDNSGGGGIMLSMDYFLCFVFDCREKLK